MIWGLYVLLIASGVIAGMFGWVELKNLNQQ
jgi:hypothetical protein